METYYYYRRNSEGKPIRTYCVICSDGDIGIGMAMCCPRDNPCKATGRNIAEGRARHALYHQADGYFMRDGSPKAWYNPELTEFEQKLITPQEVR